MLKLIHTSDIHLGATLSKLGDRTDKQRIQIQKTFEKIVDISIEKKVDMLLISGDLFDSNNPSNLLKDFLLSILEKLNSRHIYTFIIPGTHDFLSDSSFFRNNLTRDLSYINVFNDPNINKISIKELNVAIFCNPSVSNKTSESPLINIKRDNNFKYNIALAHGSIQIPGKSSKNDSPMTINEIDETKMDYLALGHWHNMQKVPTKNVTTWYSGAPEMINLDQDKSGNILFVEIDDDNHVSVFPFQIGKIIHESIKINISNVLNQEDLLQKLLLKSNKNLILTVYIEGLLDETFGDLNDFEIKERLDEKFFFLDIINNVQKKHLDLNFEGDPIKEKFIENLAKLDEDKEILDEALHLGLMLIDGKTEIY